MGSVVCTVSWEKTEHDVQILEFLNNRAKLLNIDLVDPSLGSYVPGNNHFVCGREGLKLFLGMPNFKEFEKNIVDVFRSYNIKYTISTEKLAM
jgi:hypothetical protein